MDPNRWQAEAASLRAELNDALGDAGLVTKLLTQAATKASHDGRQAAWDALLCPALQRAARKHPSRAQPVRGLWKRLHTVFFDGKAAEGIARLREL